MSMTKLFIYVASGVGFLAVAVVVFITCRKFMNKRNKEDKFRRPYDEPREYRASSNIPGGYEDEEE